MAPDALQSLFRKPSIFRRFSKREKPPHGSVSYASNSQISLSPQPAPRCDSSMQVRTPSPTPQEECQTHMDRQSTKAQKPEIITHIHRINISSPTLTSASKPASHRSKVASTALPTCPFPISRSIKTTPWSMFLPPSQVSALYHGFLPTAPTDKWYIYSEGPDPAGKLKVHFYQRWTGVKVAELFVIMDLKGEGAGKTLGIKWNGSSQMNRMGEEEAKFLVREGCRAALGIGLEGGRRR